MKAQRNAPTAHQARVQDVCSLKHLHSMTSKCPSSHLLHLILQLVFCSHSFSFLSSLFYVQLFSPSTKLLQLSNSGQSDVQRVPSSAKSSRTADPTPQCSTPVIHVEKGDELSSGCNEPSSSDGSASTTTQRGILRVEMNREQSENTDEKEFKQLFSLDRQQSPISTDYSTIKENEVAPTESSSIKSQSWLLRLFQSKLFTVAIAMQYLFKSKEPGVLEYLGWFGTVSRIILVLSVE